MPGIVPMIASSNARVIGEAVRTLPDPERVTSDPIFRPSVARHATATLMLLEVQAIAPPLAVRAPALSAARRVEVPPLGTSSITTLLELSPLPFGGDARALFTALGGIPTFYLGFIGSLPADDDLVAIDAQLGTLTGTQSAFVGAVLPDGVTRAPAGWIDLIGRIAGDPWATLRSLFADDRRIVVVDHAGRPNDRATSFQIRLSGDVTPRWTRTLSDSEFDLEQVVAADPLDDGGSSFASLFSPPAGRQFEVRAFFGDDAIPVQSILELDAASMEDGYVTIPPSTGHFALHVQITDLGAWFPPPSTPSSVERYRAASRFEPLIDGIPTFSRLVGDLDRAGHPGYGAQFTGWAFNRFILDESDDRDLVEIASDILAGGGDVRMLATKFVQDEENFDGSEDSVIALLLLLLVPPSIITHFLGYSKRFSANDAGFVVPLLVPLTVGLTLGLIAGRIHEILEFLEPSGELLDPVNALVTGDDIAIHARNPVRLRDNPLDLPPLPFDLESISDHFGIWHNKAQCVKFQNESGETEYSAFLGGIDINENRLDTPGHGLPRIYHDLHCRLTGPVVLDAWTSFNERWDFDRVRAGTSRLPIAAPTSAELPARPERHIVRVGRTYCGPKPDGSSTPLPFSPEGERSTYDTLLAAIQQARRCIYIEEQYFVYDGSVNPPAPSDGTYHAALLNAASECERLVILIPAVADQPWGEARWRRLVSELREAWGSRLIIGVPQRRPTLPAATTVAGVGRTRLVHDIDEVTTRFRLAPAVRVPESPFWLWIDGEMMFIYETTRIEGDGGHVMEVDVVRANGPNDPTRWFSTPRRHTKGTPATHSRLGSIYVHSKSMVVDDVFVSVGSANLNRRGFFHDGEINAFAIPERLAAAPDNPARQMRASLWAEHAGVSPAMGTALFADPVGGADALLRSPRLGNRFTPLDAVDLKAQLSVASGFDGIGDTAMAFLKIAGLLVTEAERDNVWNKVADPTSHVDPHPILEEL
jgi:phosphatidylserine/phosphatidylglycerophosphate/cardiolipin synthase-like enzyme